MTHTGHGNHAVGVPLLLVLFLAVGYELLSVRRPWSPWRAASFMTGCAVLVLGLAVDHVANGFHGRVLQPLLIGMIAPLGLVLGAPVTVVLRALDARHRRFVVRILRSPAMRVMAHPITCVTLSIGPLLVLYLTPLYVRTTGSPALTHLLHAHLLIAGCLFAWLIAGPDPAPHRPSVPARLVVLGIAVAAHTVVSQMLYAGAYVHIPGPMTDRQAGATLMYYGGDVAELLLALALVTSWRPRHHHPQVPRRSTNRNRENRMPLARGVGDTN
jgi:putative membrane protein